MARSTQLILQIHDNGIKSFSGKAAESKTQFQFNCLIISESPTTGWGNSYDDQI